MISWIKKVYRQPVNYKMVEHHLFDWHAKEKADNKQAINEAIKQGKKRAGIL